jgi:hypothetical protein
MLETEPIVWDDGPHDDREELGVVLARISVFIGDLDVLILRGDDLPAWRLKPTRVIRVSEGARGARGFIRHLISPAPLQLMPSVPQVTRLLVCQR